MIHNTAIIDRRAKISSNVNIGPYSIIGPDVEIEENTIIHSHVNLEGNTKIGKNNQIFPFSSTKLEFVLHSTSVNPSEGP